MGKDGIGAKSVKKTPSDPTDSIVLGQEWISKKIEIDQRKDSLINVSFPEKANQYKLIMDEYNSLSSFFNKQQGIKTVKSLIVKIEGNQKEKTTGSLDQMSFLKRELNKFLKDYSVTK